MDRRVLIVVVLLGLGVSLPAQATLLYNDNWQDGDTVAFQLGNCGGECDAVVLTPDTYPFQVNYVYAMISGSAGGGGIFWGDLVITGVDGSGKPDNNNVLGGVEAVALEFSEAGWFEVDLALESPAEITEGSFAVQFCFYEDEWNPCNYIGLGCDSGPYATGGGYIYARDGEACVGFQECEEYWQSSYAWYTNSSLGLSRNWIFRASDMQWIPGEGDDDDDATDDDDDDTVEDDDDVDDEVIVDSIEPASIAEGAVSAFEINGSGFAGSAADLDVFFGNIRAENIDVDGGIKIEGTFPTGLTPGLYNVCVENDDGGDDCKMGALEVLEQGGCDCSIASTRVGTGAGLLLLLSAFAGYRRRR